MPLYEYECKKCKRRQQVLRSFADSDVPPEKCDGLDCDSKEFEKKISGKISVQKGPNWRGGKGYW